MSFGPTLPPFLKFYLPFLLTWFFVSPPPLCLWTHVGASKDQCRVSILSTGHGLSSTRWPRTTAPWQLHLLTVLFLQPVSVCSCRAWLPPWPVCCPVMSISLGNLVEVVKRQMSREKARWCLRIQCHLGSVLWLRPSGAIHLLALDSSVSRLPSLSLWSLEFHLGGHPSGCGRMGGTRNLLIKIFGSTLTVSKVKRENGGQEKQYVEKLVSMETAFSVHSFFFPN